MTTTAMKDVIDVYYDPRGSWGNSPGGGCYRARLRGRHSIHDAGDTRPRAVANLLMTARSLGLPGDAGDYLVEFIGD